MANIGYVRVSTADQNTERQLEGVQLDREAFTDRLSGKNTDRPALKEMISYVRDGDTLHVHSIDRLGRNTKDLLNIIDELKEKGVIIHFHNPEIIVSNQKKHAMGDFMITILSGVAQMERENILTRQREGYEAAKAVGKIVSRGNSKSIDRVGIAKAIAENCSIRRIAKDFNVSTQTVQRIKKEIESEIKA